MTAFAILHLNTSKKKKNTFKKSQKPAQIQKKSNPLQI